MKKLLITALLVTIATGSIFAERMVLLQGTYLQTNRINEAGSNRLDTQFNEFGINITTFNGRANRGLGFYSSATFLLPYEATQTLNSVEYTINLDLYDTLNLGLDALIGVGFIAPITPSFSLLAAAGLHFNGVALISSDYMIDSYLKYNLGPGASVTALLYLTKNFNINISAMGAWDYWEFVTMPDVPSGETVHGGLTWALSAGLGFSY